MGGKTNRIVASLLLVGVGMLVTASPAGAALCLRWESPTRADPGESVQVAFRTLVPLASGTMKPEAFPGYPFSVEAISPEGVVQALEVRPGTDPQVWRGSFVPQEAGIWEVQVENFESVLGGTDASCYTKLHVQVGTAAGGLAWWGWTAIATGVAAAAAVSAWGLVRLRRRGGQPTFGS